MNDAVAVAGIHAAIGMRRLRVAAATGILGTHGPGSWSGKSFDGPLQSIPRDLHEGPPAAELRTLVKGNPARGRPARQARYPETLSCFAGRCSPPPLAWKGPERVAAPTAREAGARSHCA